MPRLENKIVSNGILEITEVEEVLTFFDDFIDFYIDGIEPQITKDFRGDLVPTTYNELINMIGTADKINSYSSKHGWISPNGLYYSCGFSGHEIKAQYIIRSNKILMKEYVRLFETLEIAIKALLRMNGKVVPSDYLIKFGWCRYQTTADGTFVAQMDDFKEVTKKQKDIVFAVIDKYVSK